MEHETDAIFKRLTAELEDEFRAIEETTIRRTAFDPRRSVMVFAGGAVVTIGLGILHPLAGAVAFLSTVVLSGRPRRRP